MHCLCVRVCVCVLFNQDSVREKLNSVPYGSVPWVIVPPDSDLTEHISIRPPRYDL